jgi:hypothetical protein
MSCVLASCFVNLCVLLHQPSAGRNLVSQFYVFLHHLKKEYTQERRQEQSLGQRTDFTVGAHVPLPVASHSPQLV